MKTRRHSLSLKELFIVLTGTGVVLAICQWSELEPWLAIVTTSYLVFVLVALLLGARE
jgi:hypothetical protein